MELTDSKIENKVEGPQHVIRINVSAEDYAKNWTESPDPYTWIFKELSDKLPEGDLKKAIELANDERLEKEQRGAHINDPVIIPEASKFAFRCITRNSNNSPQPSHPDSTIDKTEKLFFELGIDSPDVETAGYILPGTIWTRYAFPLPSDIDKGKNISIIMIYNNVPFVLPPKPEETDVVLIKLPERTHPDFISKISVEKAKTKGYPTLRDICLGQIQIHFINPSFSEAK